MLRAEGYQISDRAIMRLRTRHGLLLRSPIPLPGHSVLMTDLPLTEHEPEPENQTLQAVHNSVQEPEAPQMEQWVEEHLEPDDALHHTSKRARKADVHAQQDEKWQARKRRRHTKSFAGLPPDAPGPPRYPSETTIGECQVMLHLDDDMYKEVRDHFRTICTQRNIMKKTECGTQVWESAKQELVSQLPGLQILLRDASLATDHQPALELALDVICMDVTKHLRIQQCKMTLSEAKNILGVDPARSQIMRRQLLDILTAAGFVNKHENTNWAELKERWMIDSGLNDLVAGLDVDANDVGQPDRARAAQMLYRDYMKRWRDAVKLVEAGHTARGHSSIDHDAKNLQTHVSADLADTAHLPPTDTAEVEAPHFVAGSISDMTSVEMQNAMANASVMTETQAFTDIADPDPPIDPSLLQAAQDSSALVELSATWP